MNTYVTCFPANKYVFSILMRFAGGGWDGGTCPLEGGVDTEA